MAPWLSLTEAVQVERRSRKWQIGRLRIGAARAHYNVVYIDYNLVQVKMRPGSGAERRAAPERSPGGEDSSRGRGPGGGSSRNKKRRDYM